MTKLQISLIAATVVVGVAASLMVRSRAQLQLQQREAVAREQDQQLAELAVEHQRLSNLVTRAANAPAKEQVAELEKVRNEATGLRAQNKEMEKKAMKKQQSRPAKPAPSQPQYSPEYYEELQRVSAGKTA